MPSKLAEKSTFFEISDRWANREQVIYGRIWFDFLSLSPSYELARKDRNEGLSDADRARRPKDFAKVLAVFDDLGDVRRIHFDEWWHAKGIRYFGYQGQRPSVFAIEELMSGTHDPTARLSARSAAYIKENWYEQGEQTCLVVSIPVGLPKGQIISNITDLLSRFEHRNKKIETSLPKYPLVKKRKDVDSLYRYFSCLVHKANMPTAKLFEIGVLAVLSSTYSARIARDHHYGKEISIEDRHALKILTSRAINRGIMIAENAARGIFPSYANNSNAIKPCWSELWNIIANRMEFEDEM